MIKVENLTKRYANIVAVNNISFEVEEGEIIGFLGPNGAGKTTTMRILTCFMPATSGKATVAGYDVFEDSLNVRRNIGYMPENSPLYPEMRVRKYLDFRAKLKKVPRRERAKRIDEIMEQCGISDVQNKINGHLSKGYRQRVCLADSLVHDPKVLILDEPTIGLDPNQIREVRNLIKSLAEKHTIILSTHILPEVEMICNRVIVIHEGKIVAEDTIENLKTDFSIVADIKGPRQDVQTTLEQIEGVAGVSCEGDGEYNTFTIKTKKGKDLREEIFNCITSNQWLARELKLVSASLEDIFINAVSGK